MSNNRRTPMRRNGNQNINRLLNDWYNLKQQQSELRYQEKYIKRQIHQIMNDQNTNRLESAQLD